MHLPLPFLRRRPVNELPAFVRVVGTEDVQWNRPVFRAPPLKVRTPVIDPAVFATDIYHESAGGL